MALKAWQQKQKQTNRLHQTIKFLHSKGSNQKMNRQTMEWDKIFANHISDNGLISKIYKECIHSKKKKGNLQEPKYTFFQNTDKWPTSIWKDAWHIAISGKCKLNYIEISPHTWYSHFKKEKNISIGDPVKNGNSCFQLAAMYTGSTIWKRVEWFLKKLKIRLPYNSTIPLLGIFPVK